MCDNSWQKYMFTWGLHTYLHTSEYCIIFCTTFPLQYERGWARNVLFIALLSSPCWENMFTKKN